VSTLTSLLDFVLPPACAGCAGALHQGSRGPRICPGCRSRLRPVPHPRCERCQAPRGTGLPNDRECPECAEWPEVVGWARSGFVLVEPASTLVHALKYGGWPKLGGEMAELLLRHRILPVDLDPGAPLVPVPTTPSRERERGYNQAGVLARALSELTGRPVLDALVRREGGGTQVSLHPAERRANVLEAFTLEAGSGAELAGREVVLVDDVLTTGATATAAAEVLAEGGAARVGVVTFARALAGTISGTDPAGDLGVPSLPPVRRPGAHH